MINSEPTFYDATAEADNTVVATLSNFFVHKSIEKYPQVQCVTMLDLKRDDIFWLLDHFFKQLLFFKVVNALSNKMAWTLNQNTINKLNQVKLVEIPAKQYFCSRNLVCIRDSQHVCAKQ